MGTLINDAIHLPIPRPEPIQGGGLRGQVIEIDTFGNLSTNIDKTHLFSFGEVFIQIADHRIDGLVNTFGDRPKGTLIALYGTSHDLSISIVNGDAAHTLNVSVGDVVEVYPQAKAESI
jgi:S-adenosylmethionine hydrolase